MKTILNKIEFHYTYLIVALGLVLTGHFSNLLIFTSLILIHEFGHALTALLFHYQIDKIIIYPYGGLTKLKSLLNSNIYHDLLIAISGLFLQTLYYLIVSLLYSKGIIRAYIYNLYTLYHTSMLIFNLLPIVPLDGSKILNLLLSKYLNYNLANNLTIFISLCTLIALLLSNIYEKNYSFILVIGILLTNIYKSYRKLSYLYNRFLVERYLYNIDFPKKKIIDDISKFYKNRTHFIIQNGKIISEKTLLYNFFHKKT